MKLLFLVIIIVYSAASTTAHPISSGIITRLSIEISNRTIWKILKFKLTSKFELMQVIKQIFFSIIQKVQFIFVTVGAVFWVWASIKNVASFLSCTQSGLFFFYTNRLARLSCLNQSCLYDFVLFLFFILIYAFSWHDIFVFFFFFLLFFFATATGRGWLEVKLAPLLFW